MLNIPQATKPSVDIHVVLPHRISKFIIFTDTSSGQYSILYHIKFDNIVNLSIAINESISFVQYLMLFLVITGYYKLAENIDFMLNY